MLREPQSRPVENVQVPQKDPKKGRLRLIKLEERIAPDAHYNPQGKKVGAGNGHNWV